MCPPQPLARSKESLVALWRSARTPPDQAWPI
jgi:hypothetical protein